MADLDAAVAFYRDGLGLDVQGAPANADANPALRNMFGLPDAQLRWLIGRPGGMRTGVEMVEISKANGRALDAPHAGHRRVHAHRFVRDIDATLTRLKSLARADRDARRRRGHDSRRQQGESGDGHRSRRATSSS